MFRRSTTGENRVRKLKVTPGELTLNTGASVNEFSTDGTLSGNSDTAVCKEKAVKTYVTSTSAGKDEFTELLDTPSSYTTAGALLRLNGTPDAIEESTTILSDPAANQFAIARGTSTLTVTGSSTVNQSVDTTATPSFAGLQLTNTVTNIDTDNTLSANSDSYLATQKATKAYTDAHSGSDGSSHTYISQDVTSSGTPTFSTVNISASSTASSKDTGALIVQNGGIGCEKKIYAGQGHYSENGLFYGANLGTGYWYQVCAPFDGSYQWIRLQLFQFDNNYINDVLNFGFHLNNTATWDSTQVQHDCVMCTTSATMPRIVIWQKDSDSQYYVYVHAPTGKGIFAHVFNMSNNCLPTFTADGSGANTYPDALGDGSGFTQRYDTQSNDPCSNLHTGFIKVWESTDSTSKDTGCVVLQGGLGVEKAAYIGTDVNVGNLTASQMVSTNASKTLASVSDLNSFFAAVANQTSFSGTTPLTIGTVQDIATTSSPEFASLTITDSTASSSKDTGALILSAGGLGVEKQIWSGATVNSTTGMTASNALYKAVNLSQNKWWTIGPPFDGANAHLWMSVVRMDTNYDNHLLTFGFHIASSGTWDSSYVMNHCEHCADSTEIPIVKIWQKDSDSQYYCYFQIPNSSTHKVFIYSASELSPAFVEDGLGSNSHPDTLGGDGGGSGYTLRYDTSVTATYPPTSDFHTGKAKLWDTTDASSSTTGSLQTLGGLGVAKKAYIGTDCNVGGLTASQMVSTSADKTLASVSDLNTFFTAVANQTSFSGTTPLTIGTVQDIATTSSPSFDKIYQREVIEALSASGSICNTIYNKTFIFTKTGSAAAMVLTNPTATTHDGVIYRFVSTTAFQHNVEIQVGNGYNGSGDDTLATCSGVAGDSFAIIAYQGYWYTLYLNSVTLS